MTITGAGQNTASRPVSSNASLKHPVNHYHIAAGRCFIFDTIRPCASAARRERAPRPTAAEPKSPDQQQVSSVATNPGAGVSVIHLMKTEQFLMDNAYYPPVGGVGVRLTRSLGWGGGVAATNRCRPGLMVISKGTHDQPGASELRCGPSRQQPGVCASQKACSWTPPCSPSR